MSGVWGEPPAPHRPPPPPGQPCLAPHPVPRIAPGPPMCRISTPAGQPPCRAGAVALREAGGAPWASSPSSPSHPGEQTLPLGPHPAAHPLGKRLQRLRGWVPVRALPSPRSPAQRLGAPAPAEASGPRLAPRPLLSARSHLSLHPWQLPPRMPGPAWGRALKRHRGEAGSSVPFTSSAKENRNKNWFLSLGSCRLPWPSPAAATPRAPAPGAHGAASPPAHSSPPLAFQCVTAHSLYPAADLPPTKK